MVERTTCERCGRLGLDRDESRRWQRIDGILDSQSAIRRRAAVCIRITTAAQRTGPNICTTRSSVLDDYRMDVTPHARDLARCTAGTYRRTNFHDTTADDGSGTRFAPKRRRCVLGGRKPIARRRQANRPRLSGDDGVRCADPAVMADKKARKIRILRSKLLGRDCQSAVQVAACSAAPWVSTWSIATSAIP